MKGGGEKEKELFIACRKNNVKKAIALMDKGASVRAKNEYARTPLHEVCIEGNVELAC
jgi:ankyrin repeat protein